MRGFGLLASPETKEEVRDVRQTAQVRSRLVAMLRPAVAPCRARCIGLLLALAGTNVMIAGEARAQEGGGPEAIAQEEGLRFIVRAPGVPEGTQLDISVNGLVRTAVLPPSSEVTVMFPPTAEGLVRIRIASQRLGSPSRVWTNEIRLNGSGVIDYRLNPNGTGILGQWPAVTWLASKGTLDVTMNGATLGTTRIKTRVPPDQPQRVEWRLEGTVVCSMSLTVPMNARRSYQCDPETKTVSQP